MALSSKLTNINEKYFIKDNMKIFAMLEVNVNVGALVSLTQYYDPSLWCFTFQEFQLAPTVEEFERILDCYLKDHFLFTDLEETLSQDMITLALNLIMKDVAENLETKRVIQGVLRKFLEAKSLALEKSKNWKASNSILTLLIYGIVLSQTLMISWISHP